MSALDVATVLLVLTGTVFFLAGTLGLLRFPDMFTRLHAITKADNLGLGFVVSGLLLQAVSPSAALKLVFIWLLTLMSSSSSCYLIARATIRRGLAPDAPDADD
jgi:multicomponent Na+:H+ antiporter subunit G